MTIDARGEAGSANIKGTQGGDPGVWRVLEFSQGEASRCVSRLLVESDARGSCHMECTYHLKVCNPDTLIEVGPASLRVIRAYNIPSFC